MYADYNLFCRDSLGIEHLNITIYSIHYIISIVATTLLSLF